MMQQNVVDYTDDIAFPTHIKQIQKIIKKLNEIVS